MCRVILVIFKNLARVILVILKKLAGCTSIIKEFGAQGGVTIEDIAAKNPDAIIKYPINITKGMSPEDAQIIATKMKFSNDKVPYTLHPTP